MRTISEIIDYWVDGSVGSIRASEEGDRLKEEIESNGKEYPILYRYIEGGDTLSWGFPIDPLFSCGEGDMVDYNLISTTTMDIDEAKEPLGLGKNNTVQIELHNTKGLDVSDYTTLHEFNEQKEVIVYGRFRVTSIEYGCGTFTYSFHGEDVTVEYDKYILEQIR